MSSQLSKLLPTNKPFLLFIFSFIINNTKILVVKDVKTSLITSQSNELSLLFHVYLNQGNFNVRFWEVLHIL